MRRWHLVMATCAHAQTHKHESSFTRGHAQLWLNTSVKRFWRKFKKNCFHIQTKMAARPRDWWHHKFNSWLTSLIRCMKFQILIQLLAWIQLHRWCHWWCHGEMMTCDEFQFVFVGWQWRRCPNSFLSYNITAIPCDVWYQRYHQNIQHGGPSLSFMILHYWKLQVNSNQC